VRATVGREAGSLAYFSRELCPSLPLYVREWNPSRELKFLGNGRSARGPVGVLIAFGPKGVVAGNPRSWISFAAPIPMPSPMIGRGGILFLSAFGPVGGDSGSLGCGGIEDDAGGGFVRGTRDAGPVGAFGGGLDRTGKGGVSTTGTNGGASGLNFPPTRFSACSSRDGVVHVDGVKCDERGLNGCIRALAGGVTTRFGGGVLDTIAGDFTTGWNEAALGLNLGLSVVVVDWSLFVETGAGSFRDITVEVARLDFARGGVSALFVAREPIVRGIDDGKFNGGSWVGTDLYIWGLWTRLGDIINGNKDCMP